MNPNGDLQAQIDLLKKRLDAFNTSQTIPLQVDQSWKARGFIKTDFFVAGQGEVASNGTYELTIPGSTKNSIPMVTSFTGSGIGAQMIRALGSGNFGASSSQFDITNPAGTTFRYTWDGTGTNPNINSTSVPVGTRIVIFIGGNPLNSNAASRPYFTIINSGSNFFEVDNSVGVAENNVTIGVGGSITGGISNNYAMYVQGIATDEFSFVVFLFDRLFITL